MVFFFLKKWNYILTVRCFAFGFYFDIFMLLKNNWIFSLKAPQIQYLSKKKYATNFQVYFPGHSILLVDLIKNSYIQLLMCGIYSKNLFHKYMYLLSINFTYSVFLVVYSLIKPNKNHWYTKFKAWIQYERKSWHFLLVWC